MNPICRVCGKDDDVICYPEHREEAICPPCCGKKGHDFEYDPADKGYVCQDCGVDRRDTDYGRD